MQDWNDLRFFLAVAERGSTLAASTVRRTSQSTVFRRIAALEQSIGVTLFERRPSGYALTPAGAALLPLAQTIESAVGSFSDAAARERRRQTAVIRFSAPDVVLEYMLPTILGAFREQHPDVQIELIASDRKLNLANGEADVALRTNPSASDADVFGRCVAQDRPLLAASRAYADRHGLPTTEAEVAGHSFISLTSVLATLLAGWCARNVPRHRIVLQPDSLASLLTAVRSGLGLSVLPQFLCDRDPDLVAAPLQLPIETYELWVVSHERLRGSPAVRALMDLVAKYMRETSAVPRSAAPSGDSAAARTG